MPTANLTLRSPPSCRHGEPAGCGALIGIEEERYDTEGRAAAGPASGAAGSSGTGGDGASDGRRKRSTSGHRPVCETRRRRGFGGTAGEAGSTTAERPPDGTASERRTGGPQQYGKFADYFGHR